MWQVKIDDPFCSGDQTKLRTILERVVVVVMTFARCREERTEGIKIYAVDVFRQRQESSVVKQAESLLAHRSEPHQKAEASVLVLRMAARLRTAPLP